MKRFYKAVALVLISAAGYGIMPVFAKFAYQEDVKVSTLLFLRFAFAGLIFFVYAAVKLKSIRVTLKQLAVLFVLGGILYTVQSRFYFFSLKYISAPLACLIVYTSPVFTAILSFIVDKERLTGKIILAIGISVSGLCIIVGNAYGKFNMFGMVLAMGTAVAYALYIVLSNRVVKKIPAGIISAYATMFTAVCQLVLGLSSNDISFKISLKALIPIGGIILFSTVAAIFAFLKGLDILGPTRSSVLSMMEPVFTIVFSLLLLGEKLTVPGLIGGAAVLAGAVVVTLSKTEKVVQDAKTDAKLQ